MQQIELFYEDENDALRACIQALGGNKQVGHRLWPDKTPDKAGEHLSNCLNDNHKQKISISEAITIMRWSKDVGCHIAVYFLCKQLGYTEPAPIDIEDQKGEIQRQFIEATKTQSQLLKRLESLGQKA